VVLEVANGVRSTNGIRLSEQVVGKADVAVGIGPTQLRERGAGAGAHLGFADAEETGEVAVALPALQQELEHGLLIGRQSHCRKAYGVTMPDDSTDD
jgi:hypothetical protein